MAKAEKENPLTQFPGISPLPNPETPTGTANKPLVPQVPYPEDLEKKRPWYSVVWQRLKLWGLAESVFKASTHIALVFVVLLTALVMRVFYSNVRLTNQENLLATAQAIAAPTVNPDYDPDNPNAGLVIPAVLAPEPGYSNGVSRLSMPDTLIPSRERVNVTPYTVQEGDNLFLIADRFDLQPETILWGNYDTLQDNPRFLLPGQTLNILPTDGVYYRYNVGESLNTIAEFFGVTATDIIEFSGNGLDPYATDTDNPQIVDGTWLIIPGGQRTIQDWGPPAITRDEPAKAAYYGDGYCGEVYEGAIGNGTYIWPTTQTTLSGYDYSANLHPAIDIGGQLGNPIYAVDNGVVVYAGWSNYGYGNLVVVDHGTGWQSAYAHLDTILVGCGQNMAQGEQIATLGTTGNSSGPHLHFELYGIGYGKVNPWNYLIQP